jgi:hypothetical protein
MTMSSRINIEPINPNDFVTEMKGHWTTSLNNTTSSNLKNMWKGMAMTFNQSIYDSSFDASEQWKILQPPTGSGKTQGLIVYLSMLAKADPRVGALVVVRLKIQADEIVKQINKRSEHDVAIAKHSDNLVSIERASKQQILVITHAAYENSLESFSQGKSTAFKNHMVFNDYDRSLVVIDEAIDVVKQSQLELNDLKSLIGLLPIDVEDRFPNEINSLNTLLEVLKDIRDSSESKMVWSEQDELVSVLPLVEYIRSERWDHKTIKKHDTTINKGMAANLIDYLKSADELIAGFSWYAKHGKKHSLNTAKLILPESVSSGVVLDATASQNLVWELFGDKAKLIESIDGIRDYSNVKLNISRQQGIGRGKMLSNAPDRAALLMFELPKDIPHHHRVLVVCHKGLIPFISQHKHPFRELSVINWGAIDGRNDWDEYESVVVYGLPYRNPIDSRNLFMAVKGPQESSWLSNNQARAFNGHKDILSAIEVGYLTASIVQAINRIRCRRVINELGECEESNVFILLPFDSTGCAVLESIKKEMPNIQEDSWGFSGFGNRCSGRPKSSKHEDSLINWCLTAMKGDYRPREIKNELEIPPSSWDRLIKELKDTGSQIFNRMAGLNVQYLNNGNGRSASIIVG